MGKGTRGRKRMELLHDVMEGTDYGQLKDLISTDQDGDRIASDRACQKPARNSRRLRKNNSDNNNNTNTCKGCNVSNHHSIPGFSRH